jgi:hypothetical protein
MPIAGWTDLRLQTRRTAPAAFSFHPMWAHGEVSAPEVTWRNHHNITRFVGNAHIPQFRHHYIIPRAIGVLLRRPLQLVIVGING